MIWAPLSTLLHYISFEIWIVINTDTQWTIQRSSSWANKYAAPVFTSPLVHIVVRPALKRRYIEKDDFFTAKCNTYIRRGGLMHIQPSIILQHV